MQKEVAIVNQVEQAVAQLPPVDPKIERRLLMKIDLHMLPILFVIYCLAFLDRINIGNARIQGMEEDLSMPPSSNKYSIALFVFFIPYVLFEVPSNMVLKRLSPSTWISFITFGFGICGMCQGFVQSWAGLVVCRFLLGLTEAGLLPGIVYLMSMYYKRHEFQKRFTVFFVSTLMSGAFGGLLAYAISKMDGVAGYAGWRWIFIIEGLITVSISLFSKWLIPDWPEDANFLDAEEKTILQRRMAADLGPGKMDVLNKRAVRRIFSDWKIYVGALLYFSIVVSAYAAALFVPTILKLFGYTSSEAQIHSIPIWIAAAVVTLITSYLSDRFQHRYGVVMGGCLVTMVGYILLLCQGPAHAGLSIGVRYLSLFITVVGLNIVQPITLVWLSNNLGGHYKRGFGSALQISFGNTAGLVSSNIFISKAAPRFFVGYGVALAFIVVYAVAATGFFIVLKKENNGRDRGRRDYRFRLAPDEVDNLGDDHPAFRFSL